jgi:anti-sigma28 factor (negative regulator of flagellin synthesis)
MEVRGPGNVGGTGPIRRSDLARIRKSSGSESSSSSSDSVEISEMARWLDQMSRLPEIREGKVSAVRQEISRGRDITEDKIDQAVENMMEELAV